MGFLANNPHLIVTTDDVSPSTLSNWTYWDKVKVRNPNLMVIAFVTANFHHQENVFESDVFKRWFDEHKDWVEIGVHAYDHMKPPEGERDDYDECVKKSLEILRPFLGDNILYRPPGFQTTCKTEPMIKSLGFVGIAHQNRIKYFDGTYKVPFNTHCTEKKFSKPIGLIWEYL